MFVCLSLVSAMVFACGDATGPSEGGNVTISFAVTSAQSAALGSVVGAPADLPFDGDNGSLSVEEIWLVVDEFKLERVDGACEEVAGAEDDECEEFELGPFFVSVPLEGDGIGDVSTDVEPGTYEELKFETKAPDDDGGALLEEIQTDHFDDWPAEASMVVIGTFTPTESEAVSFKAYFDAEVKVELEFPDDDPLVVEEGGALSVTVFVDPAIWFANDDGTVDDLSMYDFETTGEVFEFEAKFEDGFSKIELDDD
jgi:hypothetical protein